jgi:hypothetical protein
MFGSPYKGILKGKFATRELGVLNGSDIVQAKSVASALHAVVGVLSSSYGPNIVMTYRYFIKPPHLEDPFALPEVWVESGNNDLFEIVTGTTLRFKGTPGAGTYTCHVISEDQDSWAHEQAIVVTVT